VQGCWTGNSKSCQRGAIWWDLLVSWTLCWYMLYQKNTYFAAFRQKDSSTDLELLLFILKQLTVLVCSPPPQDREHFNAVTFVNTCFENDFRSYLTPCWADESVSGNQLWARIFIAIIWAGRPLLQLAVYVCDCLAQVVLTNHQSESWPTTTRQITLEYKISIGKEYIDRALIKWELVNKSQLFYRR